MRVRGNSAPPAAFIVEQQPGKPGYVCVRLFENPEQINQESFWTYDEYRLVIPERPNLEADIEQRFDSWITTARNAEVNMRSTVAAEMSEAIDELLDIIGG